MEGERSRKPIEDASGIGESQIPGAESRCRRVHQTRASRCLNRRVPIFPQDSPTRNYRLLTRIPLRPSQDRKSRRCRGRFS